MHQISERMTGKIVLIAGCDTSLGLPIIRFFLAADATVIAPAKSLHDIEKLKASVVDISSGSLITQVTELPDYDTGFDIGQAIVERFGKIDIGIAVFNGLPCNNQLTEVHISDWQDMVDNEVTPFFVCARLILHNMKASNGGLYISVCDSNLRQQNNFPPLSKIASSIKMEMSRIFAIETKTHNVRYYHLWVEHSNKIKESDTDNQETGVVRSEMIGSHIMKLYLSKCEKPDEVFQLFPDYTTS